MREVWSAGCHRALGKERKQSIRVVRPMKVRKPKEWMEVIDLQRVTNVVERVRLAVELQYSDRLNRAFDGMLPGYDQPPAHCPWRHRGRGVTRLGMHEGAFLG